MWNIFTRLVTPEPRNYGVDEQDYDLYQLKLHYILDTISQNFSKRKILKVKIHKISAPHFQVNPQ